MKEYLRKNKWAVIPAVLVLGLILYYTYFCAKLYYREIVELYGRYYSDIPAHIESGQDASGYSIIEAMLGAMANAGWHGKLMGIFLALFHLGTIAVSWKFMRMIAQNADPVLLAFGVLLCNLVTAYYIPALNPYRYLGVQSGNIYHNSTYTGMKMFGTIVLLLYFRYLDQYESYLSFRHWFLFAISIILVNLTKPNFFVAFAPVMGIWLLVDLIRKKGRTFPQIFMFGLAVIPSVLVLLYEYTCLFPGGEGGLEIAFAYCLRLRTNHPAMAVIQTLAFPIWVLIFHLKDLMKERRFAISWAFLLTNFLIYLFLVEGGKRKEHGNLSWGFCYAIYVAFLTSTAKLIEDLTAKEERKPIWYLAIAVLLFAGHVFFGIQYLKILMAGNGYF